MYASNWGKNTFYKSLTFLVNFQKLWCFFAVGISVRSFIIFGFGRLKKHNQLINALSSTSHNC